MVLVFVFGICTFTCFHSDCYKSVENEKISANVSSHAYAVAEAYGSWVRNSSQIYFTAVSMVTQLFCISKTDKAHVHGNLFSLVCNHFLFFRIFAKTCVANGLNIVPLRCDAIHGLLLFFSFS